jgi:large subunit ribosomal protein L24
VEGVNIGHQHQKARNAMQPAGLSTRKCPSTPSNVMLICPKCGQAVRVSHKIVMAEGENGQQKRNLIRVCKKCQAEID